MPYHDLIGTHTQQDVELDKVFADVAEYSIRIMGPTHVENVAHLACRTALLRRGVAHITFPVDLQDREIKGERSKRNIPGHTSDVLSHSARLPHEGDLAQAADILNQGKKIVILAGRGALHAGAELEQVADILGAPIVKALLGKAAVPDDSPFTTGTVGLLGTRPSQEAMESCDTLLMVGTSFPYIEFLPKPGEARGVQIELDPTRLGLRYPIEVGLVGDSRRTLQALIPMLQRHDDRRFLETRAAGHGRVVGAHGGARDAAGYPDEAASRRLGAWQAAARRCDRLRGQRHDRDVVGAADPREARADVLALGHARLDGERSAVRDGGADRLPRSAGGRCSSATAGSRC